MSCCCIVGGRLVISLSLSTQWQYLLGKPNASAIFKAQPEDFQVIEDLGFDLTDEGEHQFIKVQKIGANTAFVAEQLAKQLDIPLRNVTYAGRKDKFAQTTQWFGLHLPGSEKDVNRAFSLPGVTVLETRRHNKKLRVGALKGNHFKIRLRQVDKLEEVISRLQQVANVGVPNYYGEQRFGNDNGNLLLAQRMVEGEVIRNRNKRSMAISALRSWLFNQQVSERLTAGIYEQALSGDALILSGSNSFFIAEQVDSIIEQRLSQRDIQLSAGLYGKGQLPVKNDAAQFESNVLAHYPEVCRCLEEVGLKQERRAISLFTQNMRWQVADETTLDIEFFLPSGCFATSVLREVVQLTPPGDDKI